MGTYSYEWLKYTRRRTKLQAKRLSALSGDGPVQWRENIRRKGGLRMAEREGGITRQTVLDILLEIARDTQGKAAERLRAVEMLGAHLGMFREEGEGGGGGPVIYMGLPPDEQDG